jgi:hypothetical protein
MSTKEEVGSDTRARRLLERTNPLIVLQGPGITGDQLPANLFTQGDFNQEKRNLFVNLDNYEVINTLNAIGEITGSQSTSGPLIGTQKIVGGSSTGTAVTVFQPDPGEVWELVAISQTRTNATGSTTTALRLSDGTDTVMLEEFSDNSGEVPLATNEASPIRISNENFLTIAYSPSANAERINAFASVIRVR